MCVISEETQESVIIIVDGPEIVANNEPSGARWPTYEILIVSIPGVW